MMAVVAQCVLVAGLAYAVAGALAVAPGYKAPTPVVIPTCIQPDPGTKESGLPCQLADYRGASAVAATAAAYPTCTETGRNPVLACYYPDRRESPVQTATAAELATWVTTMGTLYATARAWETAETAQILSGQTPTPCPTPPTPVAAWHGNPEFERCFRGFRDATRTAGILNGDWYSVHTTWGPDGTPTVTFSGTVPPYAATAYAEDGVEIVRP